MKEVCVRLDDDRDLEVFVGEGKGSHAVVFHHGGGTSGFIMAQELNYFSSIGLRAISYSRAGYSTSTRNKGRRVINAVRDIAHVLDFFDIESFSSIGHSAGGPHALATGLEPRCKSVVTLASNAEFDRPNFDYFAGVDPENVVGYQRAKQDPEGFEIELVNELKDFHITSEGVKNRTPRFFSKKDIELRQNSEYATVVAESVNRGLARGAGGRVDDIVALVNKWGFDISSLRIPILVIHGEEDLIVPMSHARWIHNQLPDSTLKIATYYGHFGLFDWNKEEIVETVR